MTKRELIIDGSQEQAHLADSHAEKRSSYRFVPLSLFYHLQRPSSLWFILTLIAGQLSADPPSSWASVSLLSLLICLYLLQDVIKWRKRGGSDASQYVFWSGSSFEMIPEQSISVGHILMLKEDDRSPADVLILASSNPRSKVYIDTYECLGESSWTLKSSICLLYTSPSPRDS